MSTPRAQCAYDAVVVGAGPNGLAAAVRLAQAKRSVLVVEASETIGGGTRSGELTLPGFVHDLCSAVHPLAVGSPYFRTLPLAAHGLEWVQPELPLAHPLEDGSAAVLQRAVSATAERFGPDRRAYERLMGPLVARFEDLAADFLRPILRWPRHPLVMARFGWRSFRSAAGVAHAWFRTEQPQALLAGLAAHSFLPMEQVPSAAFGLVLAMAGHAVGWPVARGGSQRIAEALAGVLRSLGGQIETGRRIERLEELPKTQILLFDLTPRQLLRLIGDRLPATYRKRLERFRYGPGIFKLDYALSAPIPWRAAECCRAGTIHVGGSFAEISAAEAAVSRGEVPERPFVLLAQPSVCDSSRAPKGRHTAWAYCHVPAGSNFDMTGRVEAQIERFAPGFHDCVLARRTMGCAELERKNANLVGGSIDGGATDWWQLLARPVLRPTPYRVPIAGVYLCSASTPPGAGVHGMCGFHAAEAALREHLG